MTTRIACLTPPGQGAIATLALHGEQAWDLVRPLFTARSGKALPDVPDAGTFRLGRLGREMLDEVVLAVKQTSPIPWVELHCHGGREVVRYLLELFSAGGAQRCSWQELLQYTTADALAARAAVALSEAVTVRTAAILLEQHHGALSRQLTSASAMLERGDTAGAEGILTELARWAPLGRRLTMPWRVVIAGPPNVGKSSLVNALVGYQRSVVSPVPGTTRDLVTTRIALDGWPVELIDTAGMRGEAGPLESAGIDLARQTMLSADLCLWLLDAGDSPLWPQADIPRLRLVINKIDLPPTWDLAAAGDALRVSAETGAGVPELCAAVGGWLVSEAPPAGAAVPFTAAIGTAVEQALRCLASGDQEKAGRIIAHCLTG
jgi:tRNA modification GTPase